MKTQSQELLAMIGDETPATVVEDKGSKKLSAIFDWVSTLSDKGDNNDIEDKANEVLTGMLYMYDSSGGMSADDMLEIFELAKKNAGSEMYIDGEMVWVAKDIQAVASAMQKVAMQYKLDIPRF